MAATLSLNANNYSVVLAFFRKNCEWFYLDDVVETLHFEPQFLGQILARCTNGNCRIWTHHVQSFHSFRTHWFLNNRHVAIVFTGLFRTCYSLTVRVICIFAGLRRLLLGTCGLVSLPVYWTSYVTDSERIGQCLPSIRNVFRILVCFLIRRLGILFESIVQGMDVSKGPGKTHMPLQAAPMSLQATQVNLKSLSHPWFQRKIFKLMKNIKRL